MKNGNRYFGRDEYFNSVIVESINDLAGKIKKVKILKCITIVIKHLTRQKNLFQEV